MAQRLIGSSQTHDEPRTLHDDAVDDLVLDELLTLLGQPDTQAHHQPPPEEDSITELYADDLEFLFSSSAVSEVVEDLSVVKKMSLIEHHLASTDAPVRNPTSNSSDSDEETVAGLVLSSEERTVLLQALESEKDDDDGGDEDSARQLLEVDCESGGGAESALNAMRGAAELSESSLSVSDAGNDARGKQTDASELHEPDQKAKKPRRNRKRQKDEMSYLEYRIRHLEAELERLRWQERAFTDQTLIVASRFNLVSRGDLFAASRPDQLLSVTSRLALWQRIVQLEKEETRTVVLENMRLRAQYESQLQVVKRLESLYHDQLSFAIMNASPERGFLSKRARMDTFSDDAMIFASMGRDFDAQYAQADTILESSGLLFVEGQMQGQMQLTRDEHGAFCLESISSKLAPIDVHTIDRVFWHCRSNEQLQQHHGEYKVQGMTNDTIFTKSVDPLQLPNGAEPTTVTMWIALKRYSEEHRCVAVCEAVVEIAGSISMRLRERTWNVLRPAPHVAGHDGPVTLMQSCVRMTPEIGGSVSGHDLAVGSLTNLVAGSYHHHNQLMHQVAESLLTSQFANLTV